MKKIFLSFLLLVASFGGNVALVPEVEASKEIPSGTFEVESQKDNFGEIAEETSFREAVVKILNFFLTFLGLLAVAVIIFAGFRLILSGGDDGAKEKAQKMIIYAVVGLIVVLLSFALVNTILKQAKTGERDEESEQNAQKMEQLMQQAQSRATGHGPTRILTNPGYVNNVAFIPKAGRLPGAAFTPGANVHFGFGGGYGTSPAFGSFQQQPFQPVDGGSGFNGATLYESTSTTTQTYVPVNPVNPGGQGFDAIFQVNPIVVSGDNVVDYGDGVSVPLETGRKGVLVQFTIPGFISMEMGDGTSRTLDTSDGSRGDFIHIYGERGRYIIRADARKVDGSRTTYIKEVVVGALDAVISGVKTQGRVDEPLEFSARNSQTIIGTLASYEWSCEGGPGCFSNVEDLKNIRVVFHEPGTYTIRLKVKNSLRIEDTDEVVIVVKGNTPVAKFRISPTFNPMKPAEFVFDARESVNIDGVRGNLLYRWDFNGDFIETFSPTITYEFGSTGSKQVSLQTVQREGSTIFSSEAFKQDMSVDATLGLDFSFGAEVIKTGDVVNFDGKSPTATEFEWVFPQEKESIFGRRVQNTFEEAGAYPVTLKVFDQFTGERNELTKIIYVRNEGSPTAILDVVYDGKNIFNPFVKVNRGDPVQISSKSFDDAGGTDNLRETWLVNGKVVEAFQITDFFQDIGHYTVELIASNRRNSNLRDRESFEVIVNNTPPVVEDIRFIEDGVYGATRVRVEADAFDSDGDVKEYRFEAMHNSQTILAQITKAPYTYFNLQQLPGIRDYYFRVTVVDDNNASASLDTLAALTVDSSLLNSTPVIAIHAVPGNAGTTETNFNFVAEAQDKDGDHLTFEWDFPDGKRFGRFLNYRFSAPGDYPITLTVSDDIETVTHSVNIYISEPLESELVDDHTTAAGLRSSSGDIANSPPQAAITGVLPFHTIEVGTPLRVYSQASDLDLDELIFQWDFGDGGQALVPHAVHRYDTPGQYDLSLTVSDGIDQDVEEQRITVLPAGSVDPETLEIKPEVIEQLEEAAKSSAEDSQSISVTLDESDVSISSSFQTDIECSQLITLSPMAEERLAKLRTDIDQLDYISEKRKELDKKRRDLLASYEAVQHNCTDKNLLELKLKLGLDPDAGSFEPVVIDGRSETTFFLYGEAPMNYPKALDFAWDLGDGRTMYGQNVSFQYDNPGKYRVVLTVSDGEVEVSDTLTITVNGAPVPAAPTEEEPPTDEVEEPEPQTEEVDAE